MTIKNQFTSLIQKWWLPLVFFFTGFFGLIVSMCIRSSTLRLISLIIILSGFPVNFAGLIYFVIKKLWKKSFFYFLILVVLAVTSLFFSFIIFFIDQSMPDRYASKLTIPSNIKIEEPLVFNEGTADEQDVPFSIDSAIDFQLRNSFQSGLYQYSLWIKNIEKGTIYLKAFEITKNDALSVHSLPKESSIQIENNSDSVKEFKLNSHFTFMKEIGESLMLQGSRFGLNLMMEKRKEN